MDRDTHRPTLRRSRNSLPGSHGQAHGSSPWIDVSDVTERCPDEPGTDGGTTPAMTGKSSGLKVRQAAPTPRLADGLGSADIRRVRDTRPADMRLHPRRRLDLEVAKPGEVVSAKLDGFSTGGRWRFPQVLVTPHDLGPAYACFQAEVSDAGDGVEEAVGRTRRGSGLC